MLQGDVRYDEFLLALELDSSLVLAAHLSCQDRPKHQEQPGAVLFQARITRPGQTVSSKTKGHSCNSPRPGHFSETFSSRETQASKLQTFRTNLHPSLHTVNI